MNVYQKLALARRRLKDAGLKQSGKNKGVGFSYFDLSDILPQTTKLEEELGLLSVVTFTETEGTLTVYNTEQSGESITFKSPLKPAELRGCHPVQNLGAMETYVRRYLYLLAYEIVETDAVDSARSVDVDTSKASMQKPAQSRSTANPAESSHAATADNTQPDGTKATSKYAVICDILKGSPFDLEDVNSYILQTFGAEIKINNLTDEQFKNVVMTLRQNIQK